MVNNDSFWGAVKWMVMSERQKVSATLKTIQLKPFRHPRDAPVPTVDLATRMRLEILRSIKLDGFHVGLSDEARALLLSVFGEVVRERVHKAVYPMSHLHGFSASKSTMSTNPERASQRSMADMGALVDDLRDLEGLEGGEIIDACLAWPELRLHHGIRLYTDNWHKRFYWGNSGGSHHMAVLCYELQKQHRDWRPEVEIHEEILDVLPLQRLSKKVSVFVVMDDNRFRNIFAPLPGSLGQAQQKLGVRMQYLGTPWESGGYQLVIIDHSREYSDLCFEQLNSLVDAGFAMRLIDFLLAWIGHGAPDRNYFRDSHPKCLFVPG